MVVTQRPPSQPKQISTHRNGIACRVHSRRARIIDKPAQAQAAQATSPNGMPSPHSTMLRHGNR